jgi:glucose/mannose transport system substrate-binding protein
MGLLPLGLGGADLYRKALVELDPEALQSDTMAAVFDQMRTLRGYVDEGFSGRDWNLATSMVMNGEAAFQIMGDWAKGEFLAAGKVPGEDFLCAPAPGNAFILNSDSFVMFKVQGEDRGRGPEGAGEPDHVAGLPGDVQPRQRLDPGPHRRAAR